MYSMNVTDFSLRDGERIYGSFFVENQSYLVIPKFVKMGAADSVTYDLERIGLREGSSGKEFQRFQQFF